VGTGNIAASFIAVNATTGPVNSPLLLLTPSIINSLIPEYFYIINLTESEQ
jgi:hypothetical protein